MNKEKVMSAIGNISDEYITECAGKYLLYSRKKMRTSLLIAACAALVIISVVFAANGFSAKQKHIVWNENADMHEIERYYDQATAGNIVITESLQNAVAVMTPSDQNKPSVTDDKSVFAVLITETTGVPKEEIYREFVLPLGAEEDYMKSGIVFLTRKQLEQIKCPENMAIILSFATKE